MGGKLFSLLLGFLSYVCYNIAAEILSQSFPVEFREVVEALRRFEIARKEIVAEGGNESSIPPKFAAILEPDGWKELRISGDLHIKFFPRKGAKRGRFTDTPSHETIVPNYIDGHNIDYVKGRIALDVEWNSKDQTFDRDLYAMRTYYECGLISVGIIVTRSEELNTVFDELGVKSKAMSQQTVDK